MHKHGWLPLRTEYITDKITEVTSDYFFFCQQLNPKTDNESLTQKQIMHLKKNEGFYQQNETGF